MLSWIIPPLLGGIIALSTNWLAIKMLFRPHTEKRIFGIKIPFTPGVIPKERIRLAKNLSGAITTHLLTEDTLAKELADPNIWPWPDITIGEILEKLNIDLLNGKDILFAFFDDFEQKYPALDAKLEDIVSQIVDASVSRFAAIFINKKKVYESIKTGIKEYLSDNEGIINQKLEPLYEYNIRDILTGFFSKETNAEALKKALTVVAMYIAKHIPIQEIVENKMSLIDIAETEDIILSVAGRELRLIIMLGGILGFFIGLLMLFV